jgi:nitrogen fixation-related uncharacterized protein
MTTLVDFYLAYVSPLLPVALLLCIVVGAGLLWRRNRRASTLTQLIGSSLICYSLALNAFRYPPYSIGFNQFEPIRISIDIAVDIGLPLFAISYLVYAIRRKSI